MKVLHGPCEVAGQVFELARAQRGLGLDADAWCAPHPYGYKRLSGSRPWSEGTWRHRAETLSTLFLAARSYDVVHFHGGQSFLQPRFRQYDARALDLAGVKVLQHFVGSDARLPSVEAKRNPWYLNSFGENDREAHRRMSRWAALAHGHAAVQDHALDVALRQHFDHLHVVPLCLDLDEHTPVYPEAEARRPLLAHAPSNLLGKGSDLVDAAVAELTARGLSFDYERLHGKSHAEVLSQMARADLVVDQLRLGSFGTATVEAWALGKPVVCYVMPELWETYPAGLPIIQADPVSLITVLEEWLTTGTARNERGRASRAYAESHHSAVDVARETSKLYAALGS